jgi:hypothetical protein
MKRLLTGLFDIFFVLVLCFLTLLIPMLAQGKVIVGSGSATGIHYNFYLPTFLLTMLSLVSYLGFVLYQSEKELRKMIENIYSRDKNDLRR